MRTGKEYVNSLNDGRGVYLDGQLVRDVTTHPAFAPAIGSVAQLYDLATDPENAEIMTYRPAASDASVTTPCKVAFGCALARTQTLRISRRFSTIHS